MLENENFRMWLENVERGSLITAHKMYRRIGYICAAFDTSPARLATISVQTMILVSWLGDELISG
jgi:hypothetical protein